MPALWAIGFNMIVLAGLVFLPSRAVLVTSIATTLSLPLLSCAKRPSSSAAARLHARPDVPHPTGVRHGSVDNAGG